MRKNFHEIFEEVEKASPLGSMAKVEVLRKNSSPALLDYFRNVYDPNIKFCVKDIPAYTNDKITPIGMSFTSIDQELKRAYLFRDVHPKKPPQLTEQRTKELLIQVLENLEGKEATIFADMLHKKIPYPSINRMLIEIAFPNEI